jgi:penicillin-binding protein 1A
VKPKRRFLRFVGWSFLFLLFLAAAGVVVAISIYSDYEKRAAQFDLSKIGAVPQRSAVYDLNSELYSYINGENRLVVPFEKVSGWFVQALLAREDARFWEHKGVDYIGIARAMVTNFRSGDVKQGASTITQQLARNALELSGRNYDRKALEAVLAKRIERSFSKKDVLELYMNRIYFGSGFYGIETASRGYFGKTAAELNLGESAVLAGLIRSPNRLSPRNDLTAALGERDTVLGRMVELNMISSADATAAKATNLTINTDRALRYQDDYVMDAVSRELQQLLTPEVIEFGGLRIYTTIDPQLQRAAQAAADRQLSKIEEAKDYPHSKKADFQPAEGGETEKPTDYLQASLVAIDNRTGAIRAIVGGRDYNQSKYSRALMSKRQIGSTFKPFVYAAAFQRGMLPGTLVSDDKIIPTDFRQVSNSNTKWSPVNSDGDYMGLQPAATGLIRSRNTMTVRVGEFAGLPAVYDLARNLGIGESMVKLPVAYLGAFETTLRDLTASYTAFPNLGIYRPSYLISRVEDTEGNILYNLQNQEKRVMPADTSWMISTILQHVMRSGTAAKSVQLGWKRPAGGKTGTTNDFHDAWFIGYSSSVTCGVWVGMDQPQPIMEKGYGSALALPIWVDFMSQLPEKTYPTERFDPPFRVTKSRLCSQSGVRATSQCEHLKVAYDSTLPSHRVPGQNCHIHPEPAAVYAAQPYGGAYPAASQPFYQGATIASPQASSPRSSSPALTRPADSIATPGAVALSPSATPPLRVERTTNGLRIYPGISTEPVAVPEREPVRVMRAIPVDPRERREEQELEEEGGVRIYRARPVERSAPAQGRRIVRIVPAEEF